MTVRSLGYLRLGSPDLDAYEQFAVEILGLMPASGPHGESRYFRTDDRPYRLELVPAPERGVAGIGFEVADDLELATLVDRLASAGFPVEVASRAEADEHLVTGLAQFVDPSGLPVELFYGPILDHVPVQTPLVSSFVTGRQGMGHVVVGAPDLEASTTLFRDVLGFRRRNTMRFPGTAADGSPSTTSLYFLGCNPRHHTLGLLGAPFPGQIVHFMLEVATIDDVGRALDRVHDADVPVSLTLGRHTNDHMVSFYVYSPDGYSVEIGCGGLVIESEADETTYEITRSSFWGHRRVTPGGPR